MNLLNEKPELFGIPVIDFYILIAVEAAIVFIAVYLMQYSIIAAGIFFVVVGGGAFSFINFKKFLPEYFFTNLYNYLTQPRLFLTDTDAQLNEKNTAFKNLMQELVNESETENGNNKPVN